MHIIDSVDDASGSQEPLAKKTRKLSFVRDQFDDIGLDDEQIPRERCKACKISSIAEGNRYWDISQASFYSLFNIKEEK